MRGSGGGSHGGGKNEKRFCIAFRGVGWKGEGVEEGLLSCEDGGGGFLVGSEFVDQGENCWNV